MKILLVVLNAQIFTSLMNMESAKNALHIVLSAMLVEHARNASQTTPGKLMLFQLILLMMAMVLVLVLTFVVILTDVLNV